MSDNYENIIIMARELSDMIKSHEITIHYNASLELIKKDKSAIELLEKLVIYGRELNEQHARGCEIMPESSQEVQLLRDELDKNVKVKNHLLCQKEYLNMLQEVMNRIKNPA